MGALILPEQTRIDAIAELITATNLLDGLKVALYQVDVTPTDKTVLADISGAGKECNFDGYAKSSAIVWGPDIFYDATGLASIYGDLKSFQSAHAQTKPQTIFGYWLDLAAVVGPPAVAEKVRGIQRFDNPVPIVDYPDGVPVLPRFDFGQ